LAAIFVWDRPARTQEVRQDQSLEVVRIVIFEVVMMIGC
jgi:hypothetical protein